MSLTRLNTAAFRKAKRLGLIETCQHQVAQGHDAQGQRQYGVAVPFEALWVHEPRLIQTTEGTQAWSQGHLMLEGTPVINPNDRVVLPDGRRPAILSIVVGRVKGQRINQQVFF